MAKRRKKTECLSCRAPLNSQDSPLDFVASTRGLCPECFTKQVTDDIAIQNIHKIRRCEHLWPKWGRAATIEADGDEHSLYARTCAMCGLIRTAIGPVPPPDPEPFDVSWCDLDRTVPEP